MKISMSLSSLPLSVEIIGPDESAKELIPLVLDTLFKVREIVMKVKERQKKMTDNET